MKLVIVETSDQPIDEMPKERLPLAGENLHPGDLVEFNEDNVFFRLNKPIWPPQGIVITGAKRGERVLIAAKATISSLGGGTIDSYWITEE